MADPNLEVCPDYALPEFEDARRILTVDAIPETSRIGSDNKEADAEAERNRIALAEQEAKQQRALRDEEEHHFLTPPLSSFPNMCVPSYAKETTSPCTFFTNNDGQGPTFQTSASVKVKDESLSWEEFGQANYRMLNAMQQQEWPEDRLKMVRASGLPSRLTAGAMTPVNIVSAPFLFTKEGFAGTGTRR
ncbi:hypothetical protein L210DRAFT_3656716 [Boletus edulis BED1]|uniref:Uncharacterized protein n=1 Tax=Boletus edulis BED1 TaxID=1328754 RepID=A0AAD4G5J7_BOLED|nr:hypothetical protein L210DRAFT_3656716 [Boletus edulis BED1]